LFFFVGDLSYIACSIGKYFAGECGVAFEAFWGYGDWDGGVVGGEVCGLFEVALAVPFCSGGVCEPEEVIFWPDAIVEFGMGEADVYASGGQPPEVGEEALVVRLGILGKLFGGAGSGGGSVVFGVAIVSEYFEGFFALGVPLAVGDFGVVKDLFYGGGNVQGFEGGETRQVCFQLGVEWGELGAVAVGGKYGVYSLLKFGVVGFVELGDNGVAGLKGGGDDFGGLKLKVARAVALTVRAGASAGTVVGMRPYTKKSSQGG
jgi:hypothetical protein